MRTNRILSVKIIDRESYVAVVDDDGAIKIFFVEND